MRIQVHSLSIYLLVLQLVFAPYSHVQAQDNNTPAQHAQQGTSYDRHVQETPILATLINGAGTRDVIEEIVATDPDARIFVPPEEAKKLEQEKTIKHEPPNTLNTVLIAIQFSNTNIIYLVSDQLTWLQSMAMVGGNIYLLYQFTLRLGAWPAVMQFGGRKLKAGAEAVGVSNPKALKRIETLGNYMTHWSLCYFTYGLMTFLSHMPDWRAGAISWDAQGSIVLKASLGFASALGWMMMSRKWDVLENNERPISRQAYTTFQFIRSTTVGFFVPALVTSANSLSIVEFFVANPVFVASAVAGGVLFFGADRLLRRFPQIERSMNRFDLFTQRVDKKLTEAGKACYPYLRSFQTTIL